MLQHGAAGVRPGQSWIAACWAGSKGIRCGIASRGRRRRGYADTSAPSQSRIGALVPLADTLVGRTLEGGGGTFAVDDVETTDRVTPFIRSRNWRSMLVTSFSACGSTYTLAFSSRQPTAKPFGSQDTAISKCSLCSSPRTSSSAGNRRHSGTSSSTTR